MFDVCQCSIVQNMGAGGRKQYTLCGLPAVGIYNNGSKSVPVCEQHLSATGGERSSYPVPSAALQENEELKRLLAEATDQLADESEEEFNDADWGYEEPDNIKPSEYPDDITAHQRTLMRNVDSIAPVAESQIEYPKLKQPAAFKRPTSYGKPAPPPIEQPAPPEDDYPEDEDDHIMESAEDMYGQMIQLDDDDRDMEIVQADTYIRTTFFFALTDVYEKTATKFGLNITGLSNKLRKNPVMPRVCKEVMQDILTDGGGGIDISNPQMKLLLMVLMASYDQYTENTSMQEMNDIRERITNLESQAQRPIESQPLEEEIKASQMGF
jgi:hypothetical protein